ncbi:MAG: DnaJ domain-containing protein [Methylococcaceae bacterium]
MTIFRTHYDNLKVTRDAPNAVIRAAYKALIQKYHPDIFNGSEQEALRITKLIKNFYEVLIEPDKRSMLGNSFSLPNIQRSKSE